MREAKFRGKSKFKNVWHYGSLINNAFFLRSDDSAIPYILDTDDIDYDNFVDIAEQLDDFEVIPESVGQYTNLKDKNGKEIWEGDIVTYESVYDEPGKLTTNKVVFKYGSFDPEGVSGWGRNNTVTVIGNVFEHSHLLEQQK